MNCSELNCVHNKWMQPVDTNLCLSVLQPWDKCDLARRQRIAYSRKLLLTYLWGFASCSQRAESRKACMRLSLKWCANSVDHIFMFIWFLKSVLMNGKQLKTVWATFFWTSSYWSTSNRRSTHQGCCSSWPSPYLLPVSLCVITRMWKNQSLQKERGTARVNNKVRHDVQRAWCWQAWLNKRHPV